MFRAILAFALLTLSLGDGALAWGPTGHRVTGDIAARYLSPEARLAVQEILGSETLAEASTWPDFMRSSPQPFWQHEASPFHYVTVPPGKTYAEVGAPPEGDAYTALQRFAYVLRSQDASKSDRQLALRFIVHIIGDLHQPLHAGKSDDQGGNRVPVIYFGERINLHLLWDDTMIDRQKLSYSELAEWSARKITPERLKEWMTDDPLVWIAESVTLRDKIYPAQPPCAEAACEPPNLRYDYDFAHLDELYARLQQGGVRIAAYLNALFAR